MDEEGQAAAQADQVQKTRTCPYCKEQVKPDAVLCKHCGSRLEAERPDHGGTCPYCKEQVDPAAIKCKHCKSDLSGAVVKQGGCNCGPNKGDAAAMMMLSRLGSGMGGGVFGGGGGVFDDPGHTCWQDCTDAYVSCRMGGGGATCSRAFQTCKAGCPPSGPQSF